MALQEGQGSTPSSTHDRAPATKGSDHENESTTSQQTSVNSSDMSFSKENSEVTVASIVSQNDSTATQGKTTDSKTPPGPTEPPTTAVGETKPDEATDSKKDDPVKKEPKRLVVDSNSDSEDSGAEDSDPSADMSWYVAKRWPARTILKAYETSLKKKAIRGKKPKYGPKLAEGLVDYLRAIEERMGQMETSLGLAENEDKNSPTKIAKHSTSDGDTVVPIEVKFFDAAACLEEDGSYPPVEKDVEEGTFLCNHDVQQLIRVLYSKNRHDGVAPKKVADAEPPNADDIDVLSFGVSSQAVASFFAKRLEIPEERDGHLIRFGKPFRPLIRNVPSLRERLKELEEKYGRVMTEDAPKFQDASNATLSANEESSNLPFAPTTGSEGEDDELEPFERPAALAHFRTLLAFVDQYLGKQIRLYERLRGGQEPHVAYENLWMLFDANDTICCPLREAATGKYNNVDGDDHEPVRRHTPQAYRVVATSGGLPLMSTIAPKFRQKESSDAPKMSAQSGSQGDNVIQQTLAIANLLTQSVQLSRRMRDSYSDLHVYCFYIDFDGVNYGIVPEVFVLKPFEREMEIRNLLVHPVKLDARNASLQDRGKLFLDATNVSHLQYDGLTVGPNKEEINSPVVIDLKMAFEGGPDAQNSTIEVPSFGLPSALWLYYPPNMNGELLWQSKCSNRWCYSPGCVPCAYNRSQKRVRDKIESDIRLVMEEYESEKQRGTEGIVHFKQTLVQRDLVRLLPGAVPGFALRNRRWVLLNLERLGSVEQNNEWDKLVLPEGHQKMVQAMVETHTQELGSNKDPKMGMDLVGGKGGGCIILLHGVPGVGKTSTAECVAAHTKKPLYPITCGDIGYNPSDVEKNMMGHFKLAHKWGCVLLLDEADVFLAKRDKHDVQRNGLVSVFLRILEYYSGILFLTTNRVGAIDDAFRSRLHLTLYYPRLNKRQTKNIFLNNFQRMSVINADREKKGLPPFDYKDAEPKVMAWAMETRKTLRWNGRQIRNTFQTVLALAEFHANESAKGKPEEVKTILLARKYFKTVARAAIQFNEYLLATHGAEEELTAKREMIRAPNYTPSKDLAFRRFDQSSTEEDSEESSSADEGTGDSGSDSDEDAEERKKKNKKKKKSASKSQDKKGKGKDSKRGSGKKGKEEEKKKKKKDDDSSDSE